ncbi:MAG: glycosyltransferase [Ruminococcaceae bacterium]|nr:glycosyltransferase [Oscillospiraceae bacterium]
MKPLVSIVVMTYRNQSLLGPAIASILEQDYENMEILVFDDGSPDFDPAQVEKLLHPAGENVRNTVIYTQPQNVGTVRNYRSAIEASRGEYIFPLSCDDRFAHGQVVSELVHFFQETGCRICTAQRQGASSGRVTPDERSGDLLKDPKAALDCCLVGNFVSGAALYMRRDYYESAGGYDTDMRLLEDYPFVIKTLLAGERIWFYDRVTILYGEDGVSNGDPAKRDTPVGRMLARDYEILQEKYLKPALQQVSDPRCRRYLQLKQALREAPATVRKLAAYVRYPDIGVLQLLYRLKGHREKNMGIYWDLRSTKR